MTIDVLTGDALAVLGAGDVAPADLVLADPPFNVGKDYGGGIDDALATDEYGRWLAALARACHAAAAEDATCYWFCPAFHLLGEPRLVDLLRAAGWRVREKELLVWYRPNGPGPKKRGTGQVWAPMCEFIVMAVKGKGLAPRAGWGRNCRALHRPVGDGEIAPWYHNVMTVCTPQSNHPGGRFHPCQKPLRLYQYLVQAHQGVRRVLDPTCGSGSSLVVCAQLGIDALGIELNAETAELARARVRAAVDAVPYQGARQGQQGIFASPVAPGEEQEP